MKKMISVNILILFSFMNLCLAAPGQSNNTNKSKTYIFEVASYTEAEANKEFLRFDLKATEFFFFKKDVTGFVKKMSITGDYIDSQLQNAVITIEAQALDTNNEDRNRKMLEHCFQAETHPKITVRFGTPIQLNGATSKAAGSIEVRGSSKPIEFQYVTKESRDYYIIDGQAELSMQTLSLPDPSTFFMKLHNQIGLKLHLDVKKDAIKNTAALAEAKTSENNANSAESTTEQ